MLGNRSGFFNPSGFFKRTSQTEPLGIRPAPIDPVRAALIEPTVWAYRMILGREPENDGAALDHALSIEPPTIDAIRRRFLRTAEFTEAAPSFDLFYAGNLPSNHLLRQVLDDCPAEGEEGFFRDVFGVRTRCDHLPEDMACFSGQLGTLDRDPHLNMHDGVEYEFFLRALMEARDLFTVAELGAGWGPWIVLGAVLARRRGRAARLIGVEGAEEHVAFMRQHLLDNGVDPADHHILHAIVGAADGMAHFPRLNEARNNWGAVAHYDDSTALEESMVAVPCLSIATLLDGIDRVDIMHVDIQGAEVDAISAGSGVLTDRVRRLIVGTHSRAIEQSLHELMPRLGWQIEADHACILGQGGDRMILRKDGVQVWRNDRLAPPA